MPVVGVAEILIKPVFNNVQNQISMQMNSAADKAGTSAGGRAGRGFGRGFAQGIAVVSGGLAVIPPAAGAASAALLATGGSVVTLTSSLSSLAGVAALVPAGLMSIAAGAGTILAAFSGMGDALKTAVDASNVVATANPRIAAMAIEDALRGIADAEQNAADAQVSAARRVEDAKRSLADAEANAAEVRVAAARRVADAERSLADAIQSAAEAQAAATKAVDMAERSEAKTARDVVKAQRELVKAREDATAALNKVDSSLEAANRRAIETAQAYAKAVALYDAAKADPSSRTNELAQLERNATVAQATDKAAQQSVLELRDLRAKALTAQESANQRVLDAEQSLTDAQQSHADAIQNRKDAQADVVKTELRGARQVGDAQQNLTDATKEAQKAQIDSARSIADAQLAVTDATQAAQKSQLDGIRAITDAQRNLERIQLQQADSGASAGYKAAAAMDKLTPSGREAALALLAVKDQLGGIRDIAQENFFKGFAAPLLSLTRSVMPQLAAGVGAIATAFGDGAKIFMGVLESSLGNGVLESLLMGVATSAQILNRAIAPVVESFTTLGVVGMPYMARLSEFIVTIATQFNDFIQTTAADGRLVGWIDAGIQTLKDLWSIAGSVVGIFESLNEAAVNGGLNLTVAGLAAGMKKLEDAMSSPVFQTTMTTLFSGAAAGAEGLRGALDNIASAFVRGAPAFAEFMRLGGEIAGTFIGGIFDAFSDPAFGAGLQTWMESLQRGVENIAPLLPGLFEGFGKLLEALAPIAEVLGPSLIQVLTGFATGLAAVITFLGPLLTTIAGSPVALGIMIGALVLVVGAWRLLGAEAVLNVAKIVGGWILMGVASMGGALTFLVSAASVVGGWVLMGVQSLIQAGRMALAWFIALGPIGWVIAAVIGLAAIIIANWDKISIATKLMWEKYVKPPLDAFHKFMNETLPAAAAFMASLVGKELDKLRNAAKDPIKFIVETVINRGLIDGLNGLGNIFGLDDIPHVRLPDGFARGGILPGQSSWRNGDDQLVPMRRGEGVYVSEVMADPYERARLYTMNKAAIMGRKASEARALLGEGFARGGIVNPLKQMVETQGYNRIHKGVDYAASVGTPVFATEAGRVSWSGPGVQAPGVWGGNEIHINGDSGIQEWFAHLSSMAVKVGDMVRAGQQIGLSGNTGISSGPHLHFGTFNGGWPNDIDPHGYLGGADIPSGGGFNPLAGIIDGLLAQFKSAFPAAGFMADLAIGAGKKIIDGAVGFITGGGKGSAAGSPSLYDLGGILPPGVSQVVNRTGKPEAILNPQQWQDISRLATQGGGRGDVVFNGNVGWDPHEVAHRIETKRRDTFAAFGI